MNTRIMNMNHPSRPAKTNPISNPESSLTAKKSTYTRNFHPKKPRQKSPAKKISTPITPMLDGVLPLAYASSGGAATSTAQGLRE